MGSKEKKGNSRSLDPIEMLRAVGGSGVEQDCPTENSPILICCAPGVT